MHDIPKTELERRLEEEAKNEAPRRPVPAKPRRRIEVQEEDAPDAAAPGPQAAQTAPEPPSDDRPANGEDAVVLGEIAERDIETLETELEQVKDQLLRVHADFDNYRKRTARDSERLRKLAAEQLIRDLLPVVDNLDLALQHKDDISTGFAEGVEMVRKLLLDVLQQHGLRPIAAQGEIFDPRRHEAVAQMESDDVEDGRVAHEFQRGYVLGDIVLRPTKVAVSTGPVRKPQAGPAPETLSPDAGISRAESITKESEHGQSNRH